MISLPNSTTTLTLRPADGRIVTQRISLPAVSLQCLFKFVNVCKFVCLQVAVTLNVCRDPFRTAVTSRTAFVSLVKFTGVGRMNGRRLGPRGCTQADVETLGEHREKLRSDGRHMMNLLSDTQTRDNIHIKTHTHTHRHTGVVLLGIATWPRWKGRHVDIY